jgi:hypothetical protein
MSKIRCTTAQISIVQISYELDLSRYSEAQLKVMYMQGVITKNEMNDELDERERMATKHDRVS